MRSENDQLVALLDLVLLWSGTQSPSIPIVKLLSSADGGRGHKNDQLKSHIEWLLEMVQGKDADGDSSSASFEGNDPGPQAVAAPHNTVYTMTKSPHDSHSGGEVEFSKL
ncbi:hypothetical protein L218DRAFT_949935 [Marasmius fiardii PR-910]|nr:hypothetical protein L218DRAFT_949935 [Marasmius fiardii PR-910]